MINHRSEFDENECTNLLDFGFLKNGRIPTTLELEFELSRISNLLNNDL
jgi:hypothetical protein